MVELRLCDSCRRVAAGGTGCPECGGPLTLAGPERFLGESFGKYLLESVVGAGGMGIVYRATHRTLRRPVALKLLLPQPGDDQFRRRFVREARVLAEVKHPNVVEVYDFDVNDWGTPYVVMEFLEGVTLRERIRAGGALPWSELEPVVADVAAGLGCVHRHGVVHRDLKPDNVFLARFDRRGVAKVLDFGIATATGADRRETRLTRSGWVVGTLEYLSPEQLLGEPVGPASDQYALALVVAEALTGRAVRTGKTMGRIVSDEIRQPVELACGDAPGVAPAVADVIRRATQPEPGARFADVESFARALTAAHAMDAEAAPTVARPVAAHDGGTSPRPTGRGPEPAARRWRVAAGAAALAVTALAIGFASLSGRRPAGPEAEVPRPALVVEQEIPVPVDSGRLVAWGEGLLITTGADGLVVLEPGADREPGRIGIDPADVLAVTPDAELLLRRESTAVLHRPAGSESMQWATGLPAEGRLHAGPDARFVVAETAHGLAVWSVGEGIVYAPVREHQLDAPAALVRVGTRLLAAAAGGRVCVWRLSDGAMLADRPVAAGGVDALAVHDDAELLAYGGWSDGVTVVELGTGREHALPRRAGADRALDLEFLYAGPTLAVGERGGVALWRPAEGVFAEWTRDGAAIVDLLVASGRVVALDRAARAAVVLTTPGPQPERRLAVADQAPWAMAASPEAGLLLVGAADGTLAAVDLASGAIARHAVHTLGITSLATGGGRLATASDDRTIAVWRLPELTVEWRSRAHEFLVNQLHLDPASGTLWSASSDGALKRWRWPELELLESVDTAEVLGRSYALHALWIDGGGDRVVLGTWNRAVLWLERDGAGGWRGRATPFAPFGGYVVAEASGADVLVLAGILHPYGLAAVDLVSGEVHRLRGSGRPVRALVALPDGARILAFADSEVLVLRLERDGDGALLCELSAAAWPEIGVASAAVALSGDRVAVANAAGEVLVVPTEALRGAALARYRIIDG